MSRMDAGLDGLQVASPCSASWEAMSGDDQIRFCQHCQKNVYNLSGMSRRQAEALVRENEGRLCVRFYRRRDGTVLTDNCPVGLRAARRRVLTHLAGFSSMVGGVLALARVFVASAPVRPSVTWSKPTARVENASVPPAVMGGPPATPVVGVSALPIAMGEPAVVMGMPTEYGYVVGRRHADQVTTVQVKRATTRKRGK